MGITRSGRLRWALRKRIKHLEEVDAWLDSLDPNDGAHLNNPIDVMGAMKRVRHAEGTDQAAPLTRQRRGHPNLLEELRALDDALQASENSGETFWKLLCLTCSQQCRQRGASVTGNGVFLALPFGYNLRPHLGLCLLFAVGRAHPLSLAPLAYSSLRGKSPLLSPLNIPPGLGR